MPSEIVLFDLHGVLVTNRRFTVNQRSFSLRSILGLQFVEHARSWRPTAACASLSALTGLAAVTVAPAVLGIPAAGFSVLAAALFLHGRPYYSIALHTEDGNFVPLVSRDRFLVEGVAKVLQSATQHAGMSLSAHGERAATFRSNAKALPPAGLVPATGTLRMRQPNGSRVASIPLTHRMAQGMAHSIHSV